MVMEQYDILIIGGGAAGISAAKAAKGARVLLVDRKNALGGVLLQCAHRGFGHNKSGTEYAQDLLKGFPEETSLALNTTVLSVSKDQTAVLSGRESGLREIRFSQLILATGCREIPMGALPIAGTRPKGVYTAGQMQAMMNLHGYTPEGPVVILGSGDLGLIMAKQLAEAGLPVTLVEKKDQCGAMAKNQRCLREYPIDLLCGDTITQVHGHPQISACTTAKGITLPCKTLLIAAGLIPERELICGMEEYDWLHICGNCNTVHPMVEAVINEGKLSGLAACERLRGSL
jgi:NADPH-dependent 2,4-dienoyl-CoA reductase/sulfur reductase-like enzyme